MARIDVITRFRSSTDNSSITSRIPDTILSIVAMVSLSSAMPNLRAQCPSHVTAKLHKRFRRSGDQSTAPSAVAPAEVEQPPGP